MNSKRTLSHIFLRIILFKVIIRTSFIVLATFFLLQLLACSNSNSGNNGNKPGSNATCQGSPEARAATADEMLNSQGQRQGLQITRDSNGNVERECTYRNDREHGICTIYDSNCSFILRASYENGVLHGPFANYDGNGNSDNNRSTYGMYKNGKQVGEWHIRNFAGLETVGSYDQEGLRTGIWTTLKRNGGSEPAKTERWKTERDSMGLKRNGPCNHPAGNKDGVWTTFNADGSVNKRETWVDGVLMAK